MGWWIALGMVTGFCITHARRLPALKLAFNAAQYGLSITAGVAVTIALGGSLPAAAAGLAVYALMNHLLVAVPVSLTTGTPYLRVLSTTGSLGVVHQAGNISVGLLAGWLWINEPLGLLGLVVPIVIYQQRETRDLAGGR